MNCDWDIFVINLFLSFRFIGPGFGKPRCLQRGHYLSLWSLVLPIVDTWHTSGIWKERLRFFASMVCPKVRYMTYPHKSRNSSKSFISLNRNLMVILNSGFCSLWSNPWMTLVVCLRWSIVSATDESVCSGYVDCRSFVDHPVVDGLISKHWDIDGSVVALDISILLFVCERDGC